MPRKATVDDVRSSIDATLARLADQQGRLTLPIDLAEVCRIIGIEWELRWMIPEGVTAITGDKLKIFIRSNFSEDERLDYRQRFTWAHEICHALLYDLAAVPPKPAEGAPKGAILESLCQNGAGYLLMPTAEIKRIFGLAKPVSSVDDVKMLSAKFGASFEAVIRRLGKENSCLRADYALLLIRKQGSVEQIVAAAHDIWLTTFLSVPKRGQPFQEWGTRFFDNPAQTGPDSWEKGRIKMQLTPVARSLTIAEIKQA